jgi:ribosomal protein L14E/L6E/L27E
MDLIKGTVVISKAGRDKGHALAVVGTEGGYVLIADGKERPLGRPKKKNPMHLAVTKKTVDVENVSDKALRRALCEAVGGGTEAG